jgi:hypothetical protein
MRLYERKTVKLWECKQRVPFPYLFHVASLVDRWRSLAVKESLFGLTLWFVCLLVLDERAKNAARVSTVEDLSNVTHGTTYLSV